MAEAILSSWRFDLRLIVVLAAFAWLYVRGWLQLRRHAPQRYTPERLTAYLCGLTTLFIALDSPLDAFGNLLLQAHMVQHLMLIVVAPPLLLYGQPVLAILRGLPRGVLSNGLGPFLRWRALRRFGRWLTHPIVCWLAMTWAIAFWHAPRWYELGLSSPAWHEVEHACFFYGAVLFWWPVIQVWPSRAQWPRWGMIPYLVLADFVNTALSAWLVFSSHVVYRTYELAPRLGGMSALDDQSTAGAIMWVPGSFAYLIPAFVLTMQILNGPRRHAPVAIMRLAARVPARRPFDLLRLPVIGPILTYRYFRRVLQMVLFALAVAIVIDGLFGPRIAPLNLAGVLPWTYWRGFAAIALLAAGNFFCLACPFMLPRDLARRLLPARRRWPQALRSKWLAVGLLALYFWAYEAFSLWSSPWWTAWIVLGYFTTAFVVDGLFRGASFCKYVCPIGQFHFVNSLVSPLEVKVRSAAVCGRCHTHDCIRGNATSRGCELQLFQPRKIGNFDCTFCLDCVHACPHDNVGIQATAPGSLGNARLLKRPGTAALIWILVFGALVNAAAMVDPVRAWMSSLAASLGFGSTLPVSTALLLGGILAAPWFLAWFCGGIASRASRAREGWNTLARTFSLALIPVGFSLWVAHFFFHLVTGWKSAVPAVQRMLGIAQGVNLSAQVPSWLLATQLVLLDAGLMLSLYTAWRIARRLSDQPGRALALATPWAVLAVALYAASVWILFQPMQMRGMVM